MTDKFSGKNFDINLVASTEDSEGIEGTFDPDATFRILLLGHWSGEHPVSESRTETRALRPILIDRDNFDEVMRRMNIHLALDEESGTNLQFTELDDFHPDRIFERVAAFEKLRDVRRRLLDARTFDVATAEVRNFAGAPASEESRSESAIIPPPGDGASLLAQLIGETPEEKPQVARQTVSGLEDVDALAREVVRPHRVEREDPQQAEFVATVDRAAANLMRTILHDERVHMLEAAWRALYFLVSRLETWGEIKIYLLDLSKDELSDELTAEDLRQTSLYKLLVEEASETHGGAAWGLLAGNYTFNAVRADAELLASVGSIAQEARAPFIAAASPRLLGCDSLAATPDPEDWNASIETQARRTWSVLRQIPEAKYIGLALPRFLLRLPYGQKTEPVEQFDFEEISESQTHEAFLWGNPAFAIVYLIGQTFSESGWNFTSGTLQDIESLPLYVTEESGESVTLPCAEALLTLRTAEKILESGLMPLLSFRDQDRVRLARLQSIAAPLAPLAGRWES